MEPINSRISATSCAIAPSAPGLGLPQKAPELTDTVPMIDAFQSCQTLSDVELVCFLEEVNYWNSMQFDSASKLDSEVDKELMDVDDIDDNSNSDDENHSII